MGLSGGFSFTNAALFGGFLSKVMPGIDSAVDEAGKEIIELCDKEIKGRLYPGHGFLTGNLHDSYKGEFTKSGSAVVNVDYGTDVDYAPIVEFAWGGRIAHFYPGLAVVEEQVPVIFKKKIDGALGLA